MMNLATIAALIISLFALLEITWAAEPDYTFINTTVAFYSMKLPLTDKQIKNLQPKIDGIPKGRNTPHPLSGQMNRKPSTSNRGKPALSNMFPWMCNILSDAAYFCGGSLITPTFVMTSGRCVFEFNSFTLFMGSVNPVDEADSMTCESVTAFLHPKFNSKLIRNDIALIQLPDAIDNSYIITGRIVPIRLPSQSQASKTFAWKLATVSGWGLSAEGGSISDALSFVSGTVIANEECAMYFKNVITSSNICTWTRERKSVCLGNSGGALQIKECDNIYTQIGVVSFVSSLTCEYFPAGHTRVSSYLAWISGITGLAIRP